MGIFEHFPYTNFHNVNLDWLLKTVKKNEQNIKALTKSNAGIFYITVTIEDRKANIDRTYSEINNAIVNGFKIMLSLVYPGAEFNNKNVAPWVSLSSGIYKMSWLDCTDVTFATPSNAATVKANILAVDDESVTYTDHDATI